MSCMHCVKKVEENLKKIKGVKSVKVSLEEKKADIILKQEVENDVLKQTVEDLGFSVLKIQ